MVDAMARAGARTDRVSAGDRARDALPSPFMKTTARTPVAVDASTTYSAVWIAAGP
jgi:hypothetical protein